MISEEEIGQKVRKFRKAKGMTLQRLAEMTGFTKSYLSKLELSEKGPPVATLMRIAKALEITISDILEEHGETNRFSLVKPEERVVIARKGSPQYNYQLLAHKFSPRYMDVYLITRKPHQKKKVTSFMHPGHEILYVLQGSMEYFHDGNRYLIGEGDCLYFDASYEHYGNTLGDVDVKCLMVVYNPNQEH